MVWHSIFDVESQRILLILLSFNLFRSHHWLAADCGCLCTAGKRFGEECSSPGGQVQDGSV
jgi:hypothetical protein